MLRWTWSEFECVFLVLQGSDVGVFFYAFIRRDLLKQFTTMELMRWTSLVEDYGKELRDGSPDSPATDVFSYSEEGEKRWKDLKNRVVEHVSWHTFCRFRTGGLIWFDSGRCGTWAQLEMLFHHNWADHLRPTIFLLKKNIYIYMFCVLFMFKLCDLEGLGTGMY